MPSPQAECLVRVRARVKARVRARVRVRVQVTVRVRVRVRGRVRARVRPRRRRAVRSVGRAGWGGGSRTGEGLALRGGRCCRPWAGGCAGWSWSICCKLCIRGSRIDGCRSLRCLRDGEG